MWSERRQLAEDYGANEEYKRSTDSATDREDHAVKEHGKGLGSLSGKEGGERLEEEVLPHRRFDAT